MVGRPGDVTFTPQLMMTSGRIRNLGEPSTSSMVTLPMTLMPLGVHGSIVAKSSITTAALGFFCTFL